jgi:nucleoid-associated protein YgaU
VQTNLVKQLPSLQTKKQDQPAAQSSVIYHEVQPGESLRRIAKKYFGDMDQYPKIMKDNNIKTPDQIYPGQKLKIIR